MAAYDRVNTQFSVANSYAQAAGAAAQSFVNALNGTVAGLQVPNLEYDITWPAAPTTSALPSVPSNSVGFAFPSDDTGAAPDAPTIVTDFDSAPVAPSLEARAYSPGAPAVRPADVGELSAVTLPSAPEDWVAPEVPTMLTIAVPAFGGINSYADWATRLDTAPSDLVLAPPTAYEPPEHVPYSSALLDALRTEVLARMQGGTGLAPEIEQAIWDRMRARTSAATSANLADITRTAEARGFSLPPGALHAQMREAQREVLNKVVEDSREIAIKQAELEQANVKHAIEQGRALEEQLIQYTNNVEQRSFEAARYLAENAIAVHGAQVTYFRALLEKYTAYASIYRSLIEGETAKVTAYRAQVEAEAAKAEVNKNLIEATKLQIDIRSARVELYKNQLAAVQTLVDTDRLRIEAFGERIKAYVAEINAETARTEAFKALVQADQATTEVYKTSVEAYAAKIGAQATAARTKADVYDASVRAYSSRIQGYTSRVGAEAEKVRAQVQAHGLKIDQAKLQTEQVVSENNTKVEHFKALIGLYDANKSLVIQRAKLISDNYFTLRSIVKDAAQVAAQVNAQLAASAYGTIQANANISGADSTTTQFNYSGDTSDTRAAP